MRSIAVLGSTGSIGRQALEVIASHGDRFRACALAANSSIDVLASQANKLRPAVLSVGKREYVERLAGALDYEPRIVWGADGLRACAIESGADRLLAATDGMAAWRAVFAATRAGIDVALSNKEIIVAAGDLLIADAARAGARVLPVDSEHSAVFQCLQGERSDDVASVVLTASGGPFWDCSFDEMRHASPAQAMRHPTWVMGAKNSIDSATLMNKGLEVIEASRLFGLSGKQIEVVVHRESIVHAFVLFRDGSVKSQLASPDMRVPIGFALAYPQRLPSGPGAEPTRRAIGLGGRATTLAFEPVDDARFPCLRLAYDALARGGTYPAVLSAANEEAGRAYLAGKIQLTDIAALVAGALEAHESHIVSEEAVADADRWARAHAHAAILAAAH
ncbi:MAG TPA: 1-deoxy-D-xylulose-5-phosphate reductoisomerase [Candidatus Eremiobacteraceae bacterium]|nr:1-deoxy-D-xylulose-5-phosphate reductoisomerase [Candidatus Eremiobacteraceae bacterium]